MKLLIVDDSMFMRHFIKCSLSKLVIESILEAADGYEAIEQYKLHQPDLVLLDINMPFMNGIEALREIRAYDPNARVIMISSVRTSRVVNETKQLGALGYMQKPFPKMQLEELVNECRS